MAVCCTWRLRRCCQLRSRAPASPHPPSPASPRTLSSSSSSKASKMSMEGWWLAAREAGGWVGVGEVGNLTDQWRCSAGMAARQPNPTRQASRRSSPPSASRPPAAQRARGPPHMVHTTTRPVSTVERTASITMPAARASRPEVGSSCGDGGNAGGGGGSKGDSGGSGVGERPACSATAGARRGGSTLPPSSRRGAHGASPRPLSPP